ncbi:MAG: hypothetical protein JNK53_07700, partial [Phycisphaerae bacterium]|nr:hypothetical protein [Phycisphaerae bacterium]
DPVADPWPAGWGPPHTLALDSLTLVLASFVYAACMPRARRADALVAVAALAPAGVVLWHGQHFADDAWRGSGWLAAIVAAAALWTAVRALPRGAALRAALLAVLIAAAGPMLLRSGMQLVVEHGATVADYHANKANILAARGWTPDSPQALMFERRLMQREAVGWFGLSNVLSSLLAAMAIACAGLTIAGWKNLERGTTLLLGV